MKAKQSKAQYTLEFKQEAIRLVKSGQPLKQVATTLGMPHQTLDNWLRADNLGKLSGAGERVVTPEQMELARLRAENTRLKMERDILKKAAAYFAKDHL
jgi:transposase